MGIRVTDLFSGAGGLSQGLREASPKFEMVQAVEMDIDAALTYQANFEAANVVNSPIEVWLKDGTVADCDVIVGGPPCQGFSTLGKQIVDDEKNLLWRAYAQVVKQAGPKYFVMENVPQFVKSPQKDVFLEELNDGMLENYTASIHQVNTADYGAPQSRKRMIILGSRKDCPQLYMPLPILFQTELATVADAFRGLPMKVTDTDLPERFTGPGENRRPGPFFTHELHLTRHYEEISKKRFANIPAGGNRFNLPDDLKSPCWRKHTSGSGDVMGRLHWDRPSVTIRTEFFKPEKGRYIHPEEDRAITHHEAARLMGFPDNFKWVGSKTSIARQIGNAVPIPLGIAIGNELLKHFD
ncbi:DNA cytosine methyltransferase [Corynebacterium sp. Marseille-P4321]|uniref:DNA cytosine methyltransferase n=1 Tax=Corynebacterium sp. Marseille-P4321 TaxID=2736603 RepID=UPI001589F5AF|nr:DNA cytosine methyltransferase [Corynebacterium sp. Marseille-P4321]